MEKTVTIRDIANQLSISVATVSRALRGSFDVSAETRERVKATAKALHYHPNYHARALARRSSYTIGIILPFITNYYFSSVLTGIQEYANRYGYQVTLFLTQDNPVIEKEIVQELAPCRLDGLLVCTSLDNAEANVYNYLLSTGLPIVFFDRALAAVRASRVLQDDVAGARLAVAHLLQSGYRKIAHITGAVNNLMTSRRLKGYLQAVEEAGLIPCRDWIVRSGLDVESGYSDAKTLFSTNHRPDAVLTINDRKAFGVLKLLREKGITAGRQFGLVGFTNEPSAAYVSPSLSSVEEPAIAIGTESCEVLIRHIRNKWKHAEERILPGKLYIRESSCRELQPREFVAEAAPLS